MKGQKPPESGRPKARRVSQRKELVVVALGMVAAISGVGGLMAANSPSWASTDEPAAATVQQTTAQQQAGRQVAEQGVRQAPQKAAAQTEARARSSGLRGDRAAAARRSPGRGGESGGRAGGAHLAGHAGLLVDVGGDVIALGTDERGEPWNVSIMHRGPVGQFSGKSLAVATPTILEADLAAKLLIIEGKAALARFDDRFKAVVTDREGRPEVLVA